MFQQIGAVEIIIVAVLILIFFGGRKLPEFIKSLGESIKEFRKGMKD
jgi:sec-independent protein translocase protein TatA